MTKNEKQLWDKITQFELDNEQIQFNFTDRLARENNWAKSYSKKVIEEYKKFIFLCCITPNGVTPSDQVDQAWHLHLTYTKSYWIDFCQNTLGQEIHHNPTQGGDSERTKFNHFYTSTKEEYIKAFGEEPPQDVWPENEERFSEIHFQRVNIHRHWIIKKPTVKLKQKVAALLIVAAISLGIQAQTIEENSLAKWIFGIVFVALLILYFIRVEKDSGNSNGSGCSGGCSFTSGCSSDSGGHSGCSGCGSGCSGCGGCGS